MRTKNIKYKIHRIALITRFISRLCNLHLCYSWSIYKSWWTRSARAGRSPYLRAKCRSAGFIKALPPLHSFQLYRDGVHRCEINRTAVSLSSGGPRPLLSQPPFERTDGSNDPESWERSRGRDTRTRLIIHSQASRTDVCISLEKNPSL